MNLIIRIPVLVSVNSALAHAYIIKVPFGQERNPQLLCVARHKSA